jgi:hypothetical protein
MEQRELEVDLEQRNKGLIWSRGTRGRYGAEEPGVDMEQMNHGQLWSRGN